MISIPFHRFRPSADWLRRAALVQDRIQAIAATLEGASAAEIETILARLRKEIASQSSLWTELKTDLAELSSGKCWYCESRENRSDLAVDHFRPKNKVKECEGHHGYWWLAFDPTNYRYACDVCNSSHTNKEGETLGKSTHFPLLDESRRVYDPTGNIHNERPALLDPILEADVALLSFLEEGSAVPGHSETTHPVFFKRATISVRVFNLNDVRIREERFAIADEIRRQVAIGEKYFNAAGMGDEAAMDHFKEANRKIQRLISHDQEFSSAARAVLAGYRDKFWVVATLATAH